MTASLRVVMAVFLRRSLFAPHERLAMQIYEHKVDNVIMGDPPTERLPFLVTLNLVPAQQPFPTPWVRQCTSVDNVPSPPGTA
jgi:hypothetical protein